MARAVMTKAPNLACSACGSRDFGLIEDPDNGSRYKIERHYNNFVVTQEVVTLVCTQCGHLEQFADAVLTGGAKPDEYGKPVEDE